MSLLLSILRTSSILRVMSEIEKYKINLMNSFDRRVTVICGLNSLYPEEGVIYAILNLNRRYYYCFYVC